MDVGQMSAWVRGSTSKEELRLIRAEVEKRLHELEHEGEHGSGGVPGVRPVSVPGAKRQP